MLKVSSLQLGRYNKGLYSEEKVRETYFNNLNNLLKNLEFVFSKGYTLFRFPSGIFPLFDKVPQELWDNGINKRLLSKIGKLVKDYEVRATFHPGQFCSLSSDREDVVINSVIEINHHSWIFDQMGLPASTFCAINVHGGKSDRISNLVNGISLLDKSARSRLTLENCETSYNVSQLYEVYEQTGVPVVWDSHHHSFNDGGLNYTQAMEISMKTWGNVKPLQHISNSRDPEGSFQKRRAHSDYINTIPECQLKGLRSGKIQVDIEAKMKNLAIDKILKDFA